jgi:hypothetical protein
LRGGRGLATARGIDSATLAGTVLLIDALAPKRDCAARVRQLAPRPG